MIIAGSQKLSLVDYPGHLSSVVFLQGCNFKCAYCQNPDLIPYAEKFEFSEKDFFDHISGRKKMIEGVVVTGGEPTIHSDLPVFLKKIKNAGFKVKLDTNGSDPRMLEQLIRDTVLDYVAMDIKTSFSKYSDVSNVPGIAEKVIESISLILLSTTPYEFRTTCVPGIVNEEDFKVIGEKVRNAKRYCLHQFQNTITYNKEFQKIKPYSKEKIQKFRDILEGFVESVDVRGLVGNTGDVPFKSGK